MDDKESFLLSVEASLDVILFRGITRSVSKDVMEDNLPHVASDLRKLRVSIAWMFCTV